MCSSEKNNPRKAEENDSELIPHVGSHLGFKLSSRSQRQANAKDMSFEAFPLPMNM